MNADRIARQFAKVEASRARLRADEAKLDAMCKAYSMAKGNKVHMRRESVLAEVRANA